MLTFDTGDSPPKTMNLLHKVTKILTHHHNYKYIKTVGDAIGNFCCVMRDSDGSRFYLIAKGSDLYKGHISCQAYLPNKADLENTPIILAWKPPMEQLQFFIFDPQQILKSNWMNIHRGVQFRNFPISDGERFYPASSVAEAFKKLREKNQCQL